MQADGGCYSLSSILLQFFASLPRTPGTALYMIYINLAQNNGNLPRFMETISQLVNGHISRENMLNVVQRYLYLGPQSPWFGFLRSISEAWRYN